MPEVMMPQRKSNDLKKQMFKMAGSAVGSAYGGPVGGAVGGAIGEHLGGKDPAQVQAVGSTGNSSALMRRQEELETDNLSALKAAESQTSSLPEDLRQQYLPPLTRARIMEEKKRGMYV